MNGVAKFLYLLQILASGLDFLEVQFTFMLHQYNLLKYLLSTYFVPGPVT